jgi:hypothetical protein
MAYKVNLSPRDYKRVLTALQLNGLPEVTLRSAEDILASDCPCDSCGPVRRTWEALNGK